MTQYISNLNNNKHSEPRPENTNEINTIVITYSVNSTYSDTILQLATRGASIHYLIDVRGNPPQAYIDQLHNEDKKTYFAGASCWKGVNGVNNYAIGIMLVNDATSEFPEVQINATKNLIADINFRHNKTMDVVGLAEVAYQRHVAPGVKFPWESIDAGLRPLDYKSYSKEIICLISSDTPQGSANLKEKLAKIGYCFDPLNDEFSSSLQKAIKVFLTKHAGEERINSSDQLCWNSYDQELLDLLTIGEVIISPIGEAN